MAGAGLCCFRAYIWGQKKALLGQAGDDGGKLQEGSQTDRVLGKIATEAIEKHQRWYLIPKFADMIIIIFLSKEFSYFCPGASNVLHMNRFPKCHIIYNDRISVCAKWEFEVVLDRNERK